MITILYYLLKVVICSALLYSYYLVALRNKQFHQYNRFYLMGVSVLSWIVPFLKINIIREQVLSAPKVMHFANVIAENNSTIEQEVVLKSSQFTWDNLLLFIGFTISFLFVVRFVKSLWHIRKLIKQYPLKKLASLYLVMTDVKGTPFSFFKYIFWNTSIDLNSEIGKKILAHEVAHVEENHSFDKLLIELQLVLGWFNPIIWLIRNELYLIHEFIADQKSIENNDSSVLAELLLASAYPSRQHLLSNSFFFSPIKRRIQMFTTTNTKFSYLRRLTILPVMAAMVLLFAFRNSNINSKPIIKLDKQYTVVIDAGHGGEDLGVSASDGSTEKDLALAIAKKIKSLNNNPNINIVLTRETDKFITVMDRTNIANAANANLFVSIHMDNDGTKIGTGVTCYVPFKKNVFINESNVLAKSILMATNHIFPNGKLITTKDRGIWVVENVKMPAVLFESGFMSNINDVKVVKENEDKIANMLLEGISTYFANNEKAIGLLYSAKPTYYVNGVKISEKEMNAIVPDDIKSINVIKGNQAIEKYHEDGKNGVVEIVLKDLQRKDQQPNKEWSNISAEENKGIYGNDVRSLILANGVKVDVKGNSTIDSSLSKNPPLYVLDGMPLKNINDVSPSDIETINIMKDPATTAIYGNAGKNGVVLITTKKGLKGNLQNKMEDVTVIGYGKADEKSDIVIFNPPKIQKDADLSKNNEPIFYTAEKPASFPGGSKAWTTYLMKNLDRDLPYRNKAVAGKYTIRLNFVVNSNGDVENVIAENNPGYGTASEAIRVVEKGPKWIPAEQNGKKVNYLVKQTIVFAVSKE